MHLGKTCEENQSALPTEIRSCPQCNTLLGSLCLSDVVGCWLFLVVLVVLALYWRWFGVDGSYFVIVRLHASCFLFLFLPPSMKARKVLENDVKKTGLFSPIKLPNRTRSSNFEWWQIDTASGTGYMLRHTAWRPTSTIWRTHMATPSPFPASALMLFENDCFINPH